MKKVDCIIRNFEDNVIAEGYAESRSPYYFRIRLKKNRPSSIIPGEKVKISIIDSAEGLKAFSGNIEMLADNIVSVRDIAAENVIEKRFDLKVAANYDSYILHIFNHENSEQQHKIRVRLRDISAGGVCFESRLDFCPEDRYYLVFDRGAFPVIVGFKILHKSEEEGAGFVYGCSYTEILPQQELFIREYVFKRQLQTFMP